MTKALRVSKSLSFPVDAVTRTFAILAMRGAGKTNAGRVMAEEMYACGLPFVAIDPVGSWWGLRSSADGKSPGIPIPIFGGRHGDVPLERTGGLLVADTIIKDRLSCVLDLSDFDSEGAKKAFLLHFAERLYKKNEAPVHLFLEEADDYIPQKPMRDEAHLLRAWENIVRRGRARGLGMTMITQRSAVINKHVLTQAETLIAMRVSAPQDRNAVAAWVEYHAQNEELLESLQELSDGEAWVWSPQWMKVVQRIQFRRSTTFDSGATPKMKDARKPAATLADVDLTALRAAMADTIKSAEANDPARLRAEIAALKRQLEDKKPEAATATISETAYRRAIQTGKDAIDTMDSFQRTVRTKISELDRAVQSALENPLELKRSLMDLEKAGVMYGDRTPASAQPPRSKRETPLPIRVARERTAVAESNGELGRGVKYRMLTALAQFPDGLTDRQIGILIGTPAKISTYRGARAELSSAGYIALDGPKRTITESGSAVLGPVELLPRGRDLIAWWQRELGGGAERTLFDVIVEAYPGSLSNEEWGERSGIEPTISTFRGARAKLTGLELVNKTPSGWAAASFLMED